MCLYITHLKFNNCDERIKIMKWLRKIAKNSQEAIFVLYCIYKKFWSETPNRHSNCLLILPDLSQISETSPEMIRFVSSVRVNFAETLSIFYHSLHVWYHDNSMNFMIFRLCLFFIEFSDVSATCFCSCFANTMFEISGLALDTVSKQTQWKEYHFLFTFFGYSKHLQFKSKKLPKIHLTKINWWNIVK